MSKKSRPAAGTVRVRSDKTRRTKKSGRVPQRLEDLQFDPHNARVHPERNLQTIDAAIGEVGFARSIVIDEGGTVLAGEGALRGARARGLKKLMVVPVDGKTVVAVQVSGLTAREKRRLALFDNRASELAEWNADVLHGLTPADVEGLWTPSEFGAIDAPGSTRGGHTEPDALPDEHPTDIRLGDLFILGPHRVLCGDSTDARQVARLVNGETLALLHADPPYGMGKEADGIANDNLYDEKLDAFQMAWLRTWSMHWATNGSAYVWGNAPDLWRLWYLGGLSTFDQLLVRNEIVWDKGSGFGMASEGGHSFPPATERCLFVMRGQQFLGNQNKEDYWPGYEPLRTWLVEQRDRAGWTNGDVNRKTKTHMAGHWFTQSQFMPISREQYTTLQKAAKGKAFVEPYDELFTRLFGNARDGGNAHRRELAERLRETRSFFDNAHDAMTDVWQFSRVVGAERYGHATPKPVEMIARALRSSTPEGGLVGVPFGGTCPEIIAAEQLGRRVAVMELEPRYVQIIVDRWQAFTGQTAQRQRARKAS